MSRIGNNIGKYHIASGNDHLLGKFITVYDTSLAQEDRKDPSGEGIVLDIDEFFGINLNLTEIEPEKKRGSYEEGLEIYLQLIAQEKAK